MPFGYCALHSKHQPEIGVTVDHLVTLQCATRLLAGNPHTAIAQRELVTVQWAAQIIILHRRIQQRMPSMRTAGIEQIYLALLLQQQQLMFVDLECAAITIVQVDQFFQQKKTHAAPHLKYCPPPKQAF